MCHIVTILRIYYYRRRGKIPHLKFDIIFPSHWLEEIHTHIISAILKFEVMYIPTSRLRAQFVLQINIKSQFAKFSLCSISGTKAPNVWIKIRKSNSVKLKACNNLRSHFVTKLKNTKKKCYNNVQIISHGIIQSKYS